MLRGTMRLTYGNHSLHQPEVSFSMTYFDTVDLLQSFATYVDRTSDTKHKHFLGVRVCFRVEHSLEIEQDEI